MTVLEMKQQVYALIDTLPATTLTYILDLLQFLMERETATDFMEMQMQSDAYREWVGEENDVYDQVFTDVQTE